jgi:hypothetical protein
MQIVANLWWLWLLVFIVSCCIIYKLKKSNKIHAQFVGISFVMIFYIVCFISGICNILNFIWRYIL